jgi:hypothetical protein
MPKRTDISKRCKNAATFAVAAVLFVASAVTRSAACSIVDLDAGKKMASDFNLTFVRDGKPAGVVTVGLLRQKGKEREFVAQLTSDDKGFLELHLPSGFYLLEHADEEGRRYFGPFEVDPRAKDVQSHRRVHLRGRAPDRQPLLLRGIRGVIRDVQGAVVLGSKITLASRGSFWTAIPDDEGRFSFKAKPGEYLLTIEGPPGFYKAKIPIQVVDQEGYWTAVEVTLEISSCGDDESGDKYHVNEENADRLWGEGLQSGTSAAKASPHWAKANGGVEAVRGALRRR